VTGSWARSSEHCSVFSFSMFGALPWNYILAVLAAIIVCGLLGLRNSSRLAGVTITIIMLVHKEGPRFGLAVGSSR